MRLVLPLILLLLSVVGCQSAEQAALARGPVASIEEPVNGATLPQGPVRINVHAADRTGVKSIELSVNGQIIQNSFAEKQAFDQSTFVSISWTPTATGLYEISVRAVNVEGVSSPPSQIRVNITAARPDVGKSTEAALPYVVSTVPAPAPTVALTISTPEPAIPQTATPSLGAAGLSAPPVLVSPVDRATVACGKTKLNFKPPSSGAPVKSYDVELMKLEGKNLVPIKTWKEETNSELVFEPECKSVYNWRARATSASGEVTDWSDWETFQTGPAS